MIHSHCYIENVPYIDVALACGALEKVDEIKNVIRKYYDSDYDKDFYVVNLLGYGSIMMSNKASQLKILGWLVESYLKKCI